MVSGVFKSQNTVGGKLLICSEAGLIPAMRKHSGLLGVFIMIDTCPSTYCTGL